MVVTLTRDEARRIAVRAQLLDAERPGDVVEVADQLGAIKIDPTATIAPAEHTILWSRIGRGYEPAQLSKAVERDRLLFEFEGAFRPIRLLPLLLPGMREAPRHERTRAWLDANAAFRVDILSRLRAEGPLLASAIPDTASVARPDDSWYGPNQTPRMLELLARRGEIAIVGREGRHRRWDLAERVYPQDLPEYSREEAELLLQQSRLRALGIAKQNGSWIPVGTAGEAATVEGSKWKWRVDPDALSALNDDPGGRAAFLSPYDGMLFHRQAIQELFDFEFKLEQFKPKPQRIYGYFAHPILLDDRFVGMLDAQVDREENTLKVTAVHELVPFDPEEADIIRFELEDLASWLGVRLDAW